MTAKRFQIVCTACGADTFLKRKPVYEGFQKVGETLICADCGHVYGDDESVPYKDTSGPRIFGEDDRSTRINVFRSDEKGCNCRHCKHYVVNPFVQRCGLHNIEVQATDLCADFLPAPPNGETDDPLAKLLQSQ